jgi:hypothetical protein
MDNEKGEMLYYLHQLDKEIDKVKHSHFKTTNRKRLEFCYKKNKSKLQ